MLARYFAQKAQKGLDALWDQGAINSDTIEKWGENTCVLLIVMRRIVLDTMSLAVPAYQQ